MEAFLSWEKIYQTKTTEKKGFRLGQRPDVFNIFKAHLIRFHLQAGRGLVEDMIPPVKGELIPFLVTKLRQRNNIFM